MANCQLHPPLKSSLTDLETKPASDNGVSSSQPLCPEPSIFSVVPRTLHADSPHFLPSSDLIPESCPKLPQTESFHQVAPQAIVSHVSTSCMVGAIRKPSMLSQFVTPAPVRGSTLVPQGLSKDISWGMVSILVCFLLTLNATLIKHKKTEGRVDQTDVDFNEVDAQICST